MTRFTGAGGGLLGFILLALLAALAMLLLGVIAGRLIIGWRPPEDRNGE